MPNHDVNALKRINAMVCYIGWEAKRCSLRGNGPFVPQGDKDGVALSVEVREVS